MPDPTPITAPLKYRWYQFTMRGLLVFVTLVAVVLGFWVSAIRPYQKMNAAYARLDRQGYLLGAVDSQCSSWFQKPFIGAIRKGKCRGVVLFDDPPAEDFIDLRTVLADRATLRIVGKPSESTMREIMKFDIGVLEFDGCELSPAAWSTLRGKTIRAIEMTGLIIKPDDLGDRGLTLLNDVRGLETLSIEWWQVSDDVTDIIAKIPGAFTVFVRNEYLELFATKLGARAQVRQPGNR